MCQSVWQAGGGGVAVRAGIYQAAGDRWPSWSRTGVPIDQPHVSSIPPPQADRDYMATVHILLYSSTFWQAVTIMEILAMSMFWNLQQIFTFRLEDKCLLNFFWTAFKSPWGGRLKGVSTCALNGKAESPTMWKDCANLPSGIFLNLSGKVLKSGLFLNTRESWERPGHPTKISRKRRS